MKAVLKRETYNKTQTLGKLTITDGTTVLLECVTLELPWKNNKRNVSCIPRGSYRVVRRNTPKFREHFHITQVPERYYILIHPGNFYYQTRGCVLVGQAYKDINKDGVVDIINSRRTFDTLLRIAPEGFDLEIR